MSLTLKRFAEPLLDRLANDADAEDWRLILTFAAMVWNSPDDGPTEKALALGRELFEAMEWEGDPADEVRRLHARKAAHFAHEPRLVARVDVEDQGDRFHVVALSMLA